MDSPSSDTEQPKGIPLVKLLSFSTTRLSPADRRIRVGSFAQSVHYNMGQPPKCDMLMLNAIRKLTEHREEAGLPADTTVSNYIDIEAKRRRTPLTAVEREFQEMLKRVDATYNREGSNGTVSPAAHKRRSPAACTPDRKRRSNQSKSISQMKKKLWNDQRKLKIEEQKLEDMVNSSPKTPMEPIKRYPTNPYAKSPPPNSQPRTPTKSIYTASPGPYAPGFNPPTVQPHTPPTNPYRRASSSSKRSSKNHSPGDMSTPVQKKQTTSLKVNVKSTTVERGQTTIPQARSFYVRKPPPVIDLSKSESFDREMAEIDIEKVEAATNLTIFTKRVEIESRGMPHVHQQDTVILGDSSSRDENSDDSEDSSSYASTTSKDSYDRDDSFIVDSDESLSYGEESEEDEDD